MSPSPSKFEKLTEQVKEGLAARWSQNTDKQREHFANYLIKEAIIYGIEMDHRRLIHRFMTVEQLSDTEFASLFFSIFGDQPNLWKSLQQVGPCPSVTTPHIKPSLILPAFELDWPLTEPELQLKPRKESKIWEWMMATRKREPRPVPTPVAAPAPVEIEDESSDAESENNSSASSDSGIECSKSPVHFKPKVYKQDSAEDIEKRRLLTAEWQRQIKASLSL